MSKSIMSEERKCYNCGCERNLHLHHIFFGSANRKLSDQDGCTVYLCYECHEGSHGVHGGNRDLDLFLKKACQREWERRNGTREDFIKRYGRSYL